MSIGTLDHVAIAKEDLDGARRLFREVFGLPEASYPISPGGPTYGFRVGASTIRLITPQSPDFPISERLGLHHLAFRVDSLEATRRTLEGVGIPVLEDAPPGPDGRSAIWADPAHTVGIPLQFFEGGIELDFPPASPDGIVERIDHLGVAARDNRVTRDVYVNRLGFPLESSQTDSESLIPVETFASDKYGVVYHARQPLVVASGIYSLFITVADFELEVLQPLGAVELGAPLGTLPGTTQQDQGAMARFLERRGEGLAHICFKTPDIQRALDTVAQRGVELIDAVGRPGGRGGLIGFLNHRSTERILFHFVQRTPK